MPAPTALRTIAAVTNTQPSRIGSAVARQTRLLPATTISTRQTAAANQRPYAIDRVSAVWPCAAQKISPPTTPGTAATSESAPTSRTLCAGDVALLARVDLEAVAHVHEQRYLHDCSGLERRR